MSESQPFLSRHFLATTASTLGAVPFPPSGPEDSDGKSVHHNVLCITGWNDGAFLDLITGDVTASVGISNEFMQF